jgi:hypothetical protein
MLDASALREAEQAFLQRVEQYFTALPTAEAC